MHLLAGRDQRDEPFSKMGRAGLRNFETYSSPLRGKISQPGNLYRLFFLRIRLSGRAGCHFARVAGLHCGCRAHPYPFLMMLGAAGTGPSQGSVCPRFCFDRSHVSFFKTGIRWHGALHCGRSCSRGTYRSRKRRYAQRCVS